MLLQCNDKRLPLWGSLAGWDVVCFPNWLIVNGLLCEIWALKLCNSARAESVHSLLLFFVPCWRAYHTLTFLFGCTFVQHHCIVWLSWNHAVQNRSACTTPMVGFWRLNLSSASCFGLSPRTLLTPRLVDNRLVASELPKNCRMSRWFRTHHRFQYVAHYRALSHCFLMSSHVQWQSLVYAFSRHPSICQEIGENEAVSNGKIREKIWANIFLNCVERQKALKEAHTLQWMGDSHPPLPSPLEPPTSEQVTQDLMFCLLKTSTKWLVDVCLEEFVYSLCSDTRLVWPWFSSSLKKVGA